MAPHAVITPGLAVLHIPKDGAVAHAYGCDRTRPWRRLHTGEAAQRPTLLRSDSDIILHGPPASNRRREPSLGHTPHASRACQTRRRAKTNICPRSPKGERAASESMVNMKSSPPPGRQHHHLHPPSRHPSSPPPCHSARRAPSAAWPAWAETEHVVCSPKPIDESSLIFKQPDRHDGRPGRGRQKSNRNITGRARGAASAVKAYKRWHARRRAFTVCAGRAPP